MQNNTMTINRFGKCIMITHALLFKFSISV